MHPHPLRRCARSLQSPISQPVPKYTLTLIDCVVTGNHNPGGGGVRQSGGTLTLIRTVVSNNTSNQLNIAGGAGIWTTSGDLHLIDSQLIDNHNLHPGSPGGGIKFNGSEAIIEPAT